MPTNTTFTYAVNEGGSNTYLWSAGSGTNWVSGTLPVSSSIVNISADPVNAAAVTQEDIANLTIFELKVNNATVQITGGNILNVAASVSGTGVVDLIGANSGVAIISGALGGYSANLAFDGVARTLAQGELLNLEGTGNGADSGAVTGFAYGDQIRLGGFSSINSTTLVGSVLTIDGTTSGGGAGQFVFNNFATSGSPVIAFSGNTVEAICYAAGTRLLTPTGERAVEDLREGDEVLILAGDSLTPTPVTWVGSLRVNLARHPRPEVAAPIRIRRGAFADNVPHRDLLLSPEHCVFVDGRLVAAKCLVNGTTIVQDLDRPAVEYFHIETVSHSIVLAEGLPAETYLDTGNRAFFDNAGPALLLHPEFHVNAGLRCWETDACAPLATDPTELEPIWRRLADRAAALGLRRETPANTTDAAPRLLLGGREIAPIEATASRAVFVLPAGASAATLVSRIGSPADHAPYLNDHRRLGLAVTRIVLRTGAETRDIPLDHPSLSLGWHPVERNGTDTWRWTDGRAQLPLGALSAPAVLELYLTGSMTYRPDDRTPERRAA
jgi:hypothetical protein